MQQAIRRSYMNLSGKEQLQSQMKPAEYAQRQVVLKGWKIRL